jgi:hypothetical protein
MLGDDATAASLFGRVAWDQMLREERSLFSALLAKSSDPGTTEPIGNRFDPMLLPAAANPLEPPPA